MEQENCIYHYSNIDAIINILEEKKIRLTLSTCFEDTTEGRYVMDEVIKIHPEFENHYDIITSNLYVACFSKNNNSKYLQENYSTFNIGFDLDSLNNELRFITDKNSSPENKSADHCTSGITLADCSYLEKNSDDFKKQITKTVEFFSTIDTSSITSNQRTYLSNFPCFLIKPPKYAKEEETRLFCYLYKRTPLKDKNKLYVEFSFIPYCIKIIKLGAWNTFECHKIFKLLCIINNCDVYSHVKLL